MVYSLVYVSSATRLFSPAELREILSVSRENNGRLGVSGALLYKGGNLMQVLEGEEAVVRDLYAKICRDVRHKGVLQVWDGHVDSRQFADWSMAFHEPGEPDAVGVAGYADFLSGPLTGSEFAQNPTLAQKLLLSFKRSMRPLPRSVATSPHRSEILGSGLGIVAPPVCSKGPMPKVTAHVQSPLQPEEVLRILTDFGPARAKAWPGVDDEHLKVYEQGEGFADVTEGNDATWERERYTWEPGGKKVAAETLESNVWAVGSRWDYTLTPVDGGTLVTVTLTRVGKNLEGRLIGALLPLVGKSVITKSVSAALPASS